MRPTAIEQPHAQPRPAMRRCRESEVEIGKRLSQRLEEIDREMTVLVEMPQTLPFADVSTLRSSQTQPHRVHAT